MPDGSRDVVRRVFVDIVECHKARVRKFGSGGHNKIITLGSIEEQMVADHMESGLGLTQTTNLINLHRRESELEEVGRSAVYSAHLRQKSQKSQKIHDLKLDFGSVLRCFGLCPFACALVLP